MSTEHAQQPKYDASAGQDTESDGDTANAHADWILAVNVERLRGPKHENGEEVCAGDESDDESQGENTRILLETGGEHGEFGKLGFPHTEGDEEKGTED